MAKIILISDIHHSVIEHSDVFDRAKINQKLTEKLSENDYDLLFSALEGEKKPADIIIFCGDYILGREDSNDKIEAMKEFVAFLEKIEKSNRVLSNNRKYTKNKRIIIVPGNHDISRGKQKDIYAKFKTFLNRYSTPFTNPIDNKTAPTFIFDDYKLIIDCETTEDAASTPNKKIEKYKKILKKAVLDDDTKSELMNVFKDDEIADIPIVSSNTSKRFKENNSIVNQNDKYNDYLRVLVTHRPLLSSVELGKPIKPYSSTIGGYDFMRSAMEYGYKLFVHGHIHQKSCIEISDYGNDDFQSAVQLGVPALQRDVDGSGIVVINTDVENDSSWPFSIIFKTLSSRSYSFQQTAALAGKTKKTVHESGGVKILVDKEITELIDEGKVIENGDRDRVEAASYNCALGYHYKRLTDGETDWKKTKLETLTQTGSAAEIVVKPHETVLIYTYEHFVVPTNMVMHASPISSWLRKGIRVELSHFVDPGFKGNFCFPVINDSDKEIRINSREPIMTIELIKLAEACEQGWAERHPDKAKSRNDREE